MGKPRIFIDCTSLSRGGGVSHYIEQILLHAPDDCSIYLFTGRDIKTGFKTIKLPIYNAMTRILYEHMFMPLIAWIKGGKAIFLPKSYAPLMKLLPSVTVIHDIIPQQDKGESLLTRIYWKIQNASAAYCANRIIFINEYVKREFMQRYRFYRGRNRVILNGFDTFAEAGHQESKYILIPGAVKKRKNTMDACSIAHALKKRVPDKRIILTGRIEDHFIAKQISSAFDDIEMTGYVNNEIMAQYMNNAYVIIYMSGNEGFSLPIAEACYLNKPVICSDIPLHRHIYSDYPIYYNNEELNIEHIISELEHHEEKTCIKRQYWSKTAAETFAFIYHMVAGS